MISPVRPSALRHRLLLERGTLDADGALLWTPDGAVFAAIEPLGKGEAEAGAALAGRATHRIQMRWRPDVSSRDRLVLGDRVFRILAARDLDERRVRLLVRVEEEDR